MRRAPQIEWLKERGFEDIATLLQRNPLVLGMNIEDNLAPKVDALLGEPPAGMGRTIEEARAPSRPPRPAARRPRCARRHRPLTHTQPAAQLAIWPNVLNFSLLRLRLRDDFLRGIDRDPTEVPLGRLHRTSEFSFAKKIARAPLEDYEHYVATALADRPPPVHAADKFTRRHEAMLADDERRRVAIEALRARVSAAAQRAGGGGRGDGATADAAAAAAE